MRSATFLKSKGKNRKKKKKKGVRSIERCGKGGGAYIGISSIWVE